MKQNGAAEKSSSTRNFSPLTLTGPISSFGIYLRWIKVSWRKSGRAPMSNIVLVGEAWTAEDEASGLPFSGSSGYVLDGMLSQVGISRRDCFVTSVFNIRPKPSTDIKNLCGPKSLGIPGVPELLKGKYIRKEFSSELERLQREIKRESPNIIIALGATALWAFTGSIGIRNSRGAITVASLLVPGTKILPTYHSSAVSRQWELRPVVIADLDKGKRESVYKEFRRPEREIFVVETLADLAWAQEKYLFRPKLVSIDIETKLEQITCIGFSPNPSVAIVIPIVSAEGRSYWDARDEKVIWKYIRDWCRFPSLFQNGTYDSQYLWKRYGIPCTNMQEDTMLMHHALQPEMQKGLGFLASIYTDEASWKHMRKIATLKKDE